MSTGHHRESVSTLPRARRRSLLVLLVLSLFTVLSGVSPASTLATAEAASIAARTAPQVTAAGAAVTTLAAGDSTNGDFTVTKTPSTTQVPAGGGMVTYTYTVKNSTASRQYYVSSSDDKCSPLAYQSGMGSSYDYYLMRWFDYIPAGGTATWTCTQKVTQDTTNTATFKFANDYNLGLLWTYSWVGSESGTATATVKISTTGQTYSCNTIWYSSDENTSVGTMDGSVGTVNTSTGLVSPVFSISDQTKSNTWVGSAAVAISAKTPNLIYYIPRYSTTTGDPGGPLYVYNTTTRTSTVVTSVNPDNGGLTVRLGADPYGNIWSIGDGGKVYKLDPTVTTPTWTYMGTMTLPTGYSFTTLSSGDLAFDGNGTMYFIATNLNVSPNTANLFTITYAELTDGSPSATWVGSMGTVGFNGIAFGPDGKAYTSTTTGMYTVDIATGATTYIGKPVNAYPTDLASCAAPKPELRVSKTVNPSTAVTPGDTLTYTITVENIGNLAATNVMFQDIPSNTTVTSEKLNGGSELGAHYYDTAKQINSPGELPGIIAPGDKATITIVTTVPLSTTATTACNQGSVNLTGVTATLVTDDPNVAGDTDKTCVPIIIPKIDLVKKGSTTLLNADGTPTDVTYTYTVTNPGTEPLQNVYVVDDKCAPAGGTPGTTHLTYVSGDANNDQILTPDETWTFTCTTTLQPGTTTKNTADAYGTGTGSNKTVTDRDTWTVTPPPLTIDKVSDTGSQPVYPGDTITYTVTVKNTSNVDQTNVTVTDTLPAGVTYVDGSAKKTYPKTVTSGGAQTGTFTKTLTSFSYDAATPNPDVQSFSTGTLPAGATLTSYTVTIKGKTEGASYRTEPSVTALLPNGTTWFEVDRGSDGDNNEFGPASPGTWYTVTRSTTFMGTGPAAEGTYKLNWYDDYNHSGLDETVTSVDVTLTYTYDTTTTSRVPTTDAAHAPANLVTSADAITLKPGETMTVTFQVTVDADAPATLTNKAATTSSQMPTPITDTVTDTVIRPAIDIVKTVGLAPATATPAPDHALTVNAGDKVYYYYAVSIPQGYSEPIKDVAVTDDILGPITNYISGDTNNNHLLDPGETWLFRSNEVTLSVGDASKDTQVVNVGTVTGSGNTSNLPVTDKDSDTVDVVVPVFDVKKVPGQVTGPDANGNYTATYTVTVKNVGTSTNTYGPITDTLGYDPNITPVSATWTFGRTSGPTTTFTGSPYTFLIGEAGTSLASGASNVYTVTVVFSYAGTPAASDCDGTPGHGLYNSVTLPNNQEPPVNNGNNWACMPPPPSFAVSKAVAGSLAGITGPVQTVSADGWVTVNYTVTVTNTGNVTGMHPEITDTLIAPAGFLITEVKLDGELQTATDGGFTIPADMTELQPGGVRTYSLVVRLKAVNMATTDWTNAKACNTEGEGTPGGGVFNLVTMVHDTNGVDDNDACAPLEPPKATITLQKLAENCDVGQPTCTLGGAQFALYSSDPTKSPVTVVSDPVALDKSRTDGSLFLMPDLSMFTSYWLVETKAPDGFALLAEPVKFMITAGGIQLSSGTSSAITVTGTDKLALDVIDQPAAELPASGGPGPYGSVLLGLLFVLTGVALQRLFNPRVPGRHASG